MAQHPLQEHRRVLAASMIGTAIEYYDFFIFGTAAALFFGPLFFPSHDPATATLLSFMTFGVAFVARPFGAVLFGHFGDRVGRKSTLVGSLLLMGASTLLIALLPTHAQAGWIAPALLCLLRVGQGLGLGGEWAGASLLAVEHAPEGWRGRFASAPQLGVPAGFILANGTFLLLGLTLDEAALASWGWRVPFLLSAVLVGVGLWMRLRISETPEFRAALASEAPEPVPFLRLLRDHPGALLAGSAGAITCYAVFYIATSFALAEATGRLGYARETFLGIQMVASLALAAGNLLGGARADRSSPRAMVGIGAVAVMAVGLVFGAGLAGGLWLAGVTLALAFLAMGLGNTPLAAWLGSLFPARVRYSGVAFAHNIGGIVGGGLMPIAAQVMSGSGWGGLTGLLLSLAGLLTLLGTLHKGKPQA